MRSRKEAIQRPIIPQKQDAGRVMICGFAIKPSANQAATNEYRHAPPFEAYLPYAQRANKKKSMLRTFLRSAAHATDSTLTGCNANNAATSQLGHSSVVASSSRSE